MDDPVAASGPVGAASRSRHILLCLDRTAQGEYPIPYAIALAKAFDGSLTVTSVLQPGAERHVGPATDAIGWEIGRQEAEAYLERVRGELAAALSMPVEVRLEQGKASDRILDVMRETDAGITILGSSAGSPGSPSSLGSTVQQVLNRARSSLLIVHPSSPPTALFAPHRILVPLDGSIRAESVLPTATRIARSVKGELLLVHVIQEPATSEILQEGADLKAARDLVERLGEAAERYLGRLKGQLVRKGISVQTLVIRNPSEHESLLAVARSDRSDLVVLSAHGSASDSRRTFGSATVCLLAQASVPVLVLQDLPGQTIPQEAVMDGMQSPPLRGAHSSEAV